MTAETIRLKFTGKKEIHKTLLDIFNYHNKEMKKTVGFSVEKVTLTKYLTVRKKVAAFIQHQYERSDIYIQELNYQFVTNFELYLKSVDHIDHNTTMRYIRNLKKIINEAVRNQRLEHNPFDGFKCSLRKIERSVLSEEEIDKIKNKNWSTSGTTVLYRPDRGTGSGIQTAAPC